MACALRPSVRRRVVGYVAQAPSPPLAVVWKLAVLKVIQSEAFGVSVHRRNDSCVLGSIPDARVRDHADAGEDSNDNDDDEQLHDREAVFLC